MDIVGLSGCAIMRNPASRPFLPHRRVDHRRRRQLGSPGDIFPEPLNEDEIIPHNEGDQAQVYDDGERLHQAQCRRCREAAEKVNLPEPVDAKGAGVDGQCEARDFDE